MAKKSKKLFKVEEESEEVYPEEEQGIVPEDTPEEQELHIQKGEDEADVYSEKGRELLEDDDEIEPWEQGFMEGAHDAGQLGKDAFTGEPLKGVDDVIEMKIGQTVYRFANRKNAEKFKEKMGKKG